MTIKLRRGFGLVMINGREYCCGGRGSSSWMPYHTLQLIKGALLILKFVLPISLLELSYKNDFIKSKILCLNHKINFPERLPWELSKSGNILCIWMSLHSAFPTPQHSTPTDPLWTEKFCALGRHLPTLPASPPPPMGVCTIVVSTASLCPLISGKFILFYLHIIL